VVNTNEGGSIFKNSFSPSCSVLHVIEMVTEVVWMHAHPRKDRGGPDGSVVIDFSSG
jgi:hypothetical protein